MHEIRISHNNQNIITVLAQQYEDNRKVRFKEPSNEYINCQVTIDGYSLADVGVRYKGVSSYSSTRSIKKSLKLDFNEFVKGQSFQGLKKINLHNGMGDPSFQREALSYALLRQAGAPYCRTAYAKVFLNKKYMGLYLIVEQIDKTFLKRHFGTKKGTLYKVISGQDLSTVDNKNFFKKFFQLRTNKEAGNYDRLFEFIELINNDYSEQFKKNLEEIFDVSSFLKALATYTLTDNWDSYLGTCRNYYLFHNEKNNKLSWIAWDLNLTFGGTLKDYHYDEYDGICSVSSKFKILMHSPLQYEFVNKSSANVQEYYWEFGDGGTSSEAEPIHTYMEEGNYEVCLTTSARYFGQDCKSTVCHKIKTPKHIANCPCFDNGWAPYPSTDFTMQKAIAYYPEICDKEWSAKYQSIYTYLSTSSFENLKKPKLRERQFSLLHTENDKILLKRILSIPEYKTEYLDIVKKLLQQMYNQEQLDQYLSNGMDLIMEAISNDPLYLYPEEIVKLDMTKGKAADPHDPEGVKLIGIYNFINKKLEQIQIEMNQIHSR
jgi:hypothetical protein